MKPGDGSLLIAAIEKKNFALLKRLVDKGIDVNSPVNDAWYPLMMTAVVGDIRMCNYLLDHGAKINAVNNIGQTSLCLAVANRHMEIVRLLLKRRADANRTGGFFPAYPLEGAASRGYTEMVRILLDHGAKIDTAYSDGTTALMQAVRLRRYDCIALLKKRGANITLRDREGNSALDFARRNKDARALKILGVTTSI